MLLHSDTSRRCARSFLLLGALLPACPGDDKGDSDTDTTSATDTTTDTTTATTTDTTTATTTDTTSDTTTDTTETDTDTGEVFPLCLPSSGVKGGFSVDFDGWEKLSPDDPNEPWEPWGLSLKIDAQCTIEALSAAPGGLDLTLRCTEGDKIDLPIELSLSALPNDFVHTLELGATVRFQYSWRSEGHHIEEGHWFVLHDAAGERLHMIGVDHDNPSGGDTKPLTLSTDASVCPNPCDDDNIDCSDDHRVAVRVAGDGASATIVDGHRDALVAGGVTYDVLVPKAIRRYCLNCSSRYRALVSAAPE